jgi:HSP20 family protein
MMVEEKDKPTFEGNINIDLGFGNLFKGLGNFLDVLSELVEKAEEVQERTGEFTAGTTAKGEPIRGVYGIRVSTLAKGGAPKVETFGNIRATEKGPVVDERREPIIDIFDEDDSILLVAEVPGVADDEIELNVEGDILTLSTTGKRCYAKEILLPAAVDATTVQKTYASGILEVRAKKA